MTTSLVRPRTSYLICTTPRTGSWLMCDALTQTGLAGYPQEYLLSHVAFDPAWGKPRPDTFDDYLAWVCDQATTDNGVCGIKVHWSQMQYLKVVLGLDNQGLMDRLRSHLPGLVLIRLSRQDKVRQALSYHRALVEDTWWQLVDAPTTVRDFRPDLSEVARLVDLLAGHEREWDRLFREVGEDPLAIAYEGLVAHLRTTTRACLLALGTPHEDAQAAVVDICPQLRKQSEDALSAAWVEQFHGWARGSTTHQAEPGKAVPCAGR